MLDNLQLLFVWAPILNVQVILKASLLVPSLLLALMGWPLFGAL